MPKYRCTKCNARFINKVFEKCPECGASSLFKVGDYQFKQNNQLKTKESEEIIVDQNVQVISNDSNKDSENVKKENIIETKEGTNKIVKKALFGIGKREWKCNDCGFVYQGVNDKCPQCGADRALRAMPINFNQITKQIVHTTIVSQGPKKYKTKTETGSIIARAAVGSIINPIGGVVGAVTANKTTQEIESKDITFAVEYSDGSRGLIKTKVGSKEYLKLAKYL